MIPTLEEKTGEKFPPPDQLHTDESSAFLERVLEKMNIQCEIKTAAKMIDALVGDLIEPEISSPAFIIGHPQVYDSRFCFGDLFTDTRLACLLSRNPTEIRQVCANDLSCKLEITSPLVLEADPC